MDNILHYFEVKSIDENKLKKVQKEIRNELSIKTIVKLSGDIKNADYLLKQYLLNTKTEYDDYVLITKKEKHGKQESKIVIKFYKFHRYYYLIDRLLKEDKFDTPFIEKLVQQFRNNSKGITREQIYMYQILSCINFGKKDKNNVIDFMDAMKKFTKEENKKALIKKKSK